MTATSRRLTVLDEVSSIMCTGAECCRWSGQRASPGRVLGESIALHPWHVACTAGRRVARYIRRTTSTRDRQVLAVAEQPGASVSPHDEQIERSSQRHGPPPTPRRLRTWLAVVASLAVVAIVSPIVAVGLYQYEHVGKIYQGVSVLGDRPERSDARRGRATAGRARRRAHGASRPGASRRQPVAHGLGQARRLDADSSDRRPRDGRRAAGVDPGPGVRPGSCPPRRSDHRGRGDARRRPDSGVRGVGRRADRPSGSQRPAGRCCRT